MRPNMAMRPVGLKNDAKYLRNTQANNESVFIEKREVYLGFWSTILNENNDRRQVTKINAAQQLYIG